MAEDEKDGRYFKYFKPESTGRGVEGKSTNNNL